MNQCRESEADALRKSRQASSGNTRKKPLLLAVDDDPDNLLLLIHVLGRLGYDFITATDGQSGLNLAIQYQPDLILMDIMLPQLDGYGFIQRMRMMPEIASTPAVAVTALAGAEDRERIFLAGFIDQIVKPYLLKDLQGKLTRWLGLQPEVWGGTCEQLN
jgi:two-component system, cell cycle response regulator DivK